MSGLCGVGEATPNADEQGSTKAVGFLPRPQFVRCLQGPVLSPPWLGPAQPITLRSTGQAWQLPYPRATHIFHTGNPCALS